MRNCVYFDPVLPMLPHRYSGCCVVDVVYPLFKALGSPQTCHRDWPGKWTAFITFPTNLMFLQKFEKKYNAELVEGGVSSVTQFEYAWCLIRSKYSDDIKKGIVLLNGRRSKQHRNKPEMSLYVITLNRRGNNG